MSMKRLSKTSKARSSSQIASGDVRSSHSISASFVAIELPVTSLDTTAPVQRKNQDGQAIETFSQSRTRKTKKAYSCSKLLA